MGTYSPRLWLAGPLVGSEMNRRGFLGLLAAAPVAAPAMVKAAVAEVPKFASGGYVRGISNSGFHQREPHLANSAQESLGNADGKC